MLIERVSLEALRNLASTIVDTCLQMTSPMRGAEDLSKVNPMVLHNLDIAESYAMKASIALQDALDHFHHTPEEAAAWQEKYRM